MNLHRNFDQFLIATFSIAVFCLLTGGCANNDATNDIDSINRTETRKKQQLNESPPPVLSHDGDTLFRLLSPEKSGIDFENIIIETNNENILTYSYMYNGGGVAAGDVNNDGLTDLFFTSNQGQNKLYLNRGGMRFDDVSDSAGIAASTGWHSGVNMADVNGDGWLDIYVCRSGPFATESQRSNLLYINDGQMHFTEKAGSYGVADTNHSTQASFFDYDRDGDLDLYVLNHPVFFNFTTVGEVLEKVQDPVIARENSDNLYRNNGDGSFTRVTEAAGCLNLGYGLGLITADLNSDGWTDIYVADDFSTPDFMYINQQDGTFKDEIRQRTGHISYYGMGCDLIDVNNDLHPDLVEMDMTAKDRIRSKTLMPSMQPQRFFALVLGLNYPYQYMFNSVQLNQGDGFFSEIALLAGVAKTDWSWAVLGADFDQDGRDDLVVTNGFRRDSKDNDFLARYRKAKSRAGGLRAMMDKGLMMEWVEQIPSQRIQNYLFKNNGDFSFSDVSAEWGFHEGTFSSGCAYADLDNDGDLDLVISNIDDLAFVYENQANQQFPDRKFVRVQPVNDKGSPELNSRVNIVIDGKPRTKELTTCRGYQSAVEPILHFGIGDAKNVDSVSVIWPDGSKTELQRVELNRTTIVRRPESSDSAAHGEFLKTWANPFFALSDQPIRFQHKENDYYEYRNEILLPHSQSSLGPCLAIGDVNGDERDDIFIGGSRGSAAQLLVQSTDGEFDATLHADLLSQLSESENVGATFFDADGDDDLDLYVANGGGSEFHAKDPLLCDHFFRNTDGRLILENESIPKIPVSASVVEQIDFDGDGDLDLFIGGRIIPGKYPVPPKSFLLENKMGTYSLVDAGIDELGMVNDALATDFDSDGDDDLIVAGEWTPIMFLENENGKFSRKEFSGADDLRGWWFSLTELDVNSDGRPDYLAGNLGNNHKFKSGGKHKLKLLCNDFDDSGTLDIVLATEIDGRDFPVRGKECSTQQMPFLQSKFPTFHEFAMADLAEILGQEKLESGINLSVNEFSSCVLVRTDEGFEKHYLPNAAQLSPIRDALAIDVNQDGHQDIVVVGNLYNTEVETARYDAGMGCVMLGDGKGGYQAVLSGDSGFRVRKDSRHIATVTIDDKTKVIVVNNNDEAVVFDLVK